MLNCTMFHNKSINQVKYYQDPSNEYYVFTASSDGKIAMYHL